MNDIHTDDIELSTRSVRLTRDLRKAAEEMGADEARFLVDMFETAQRDRIRNGNRRIALEKSGEPNALLSHFLNIQEATEDQIAAALKRYVPTQPLGEWMLSITGCGHLVAARLLAFIDWEGSRTPSRIWSFAGLDPTSVWAKGEKRPWNARLKRVCYLLGESFIKSMNRESSFYGPLFIERKRKMWQTNMSGGYRERALILSEKVGKGTEAYRWYTGDVHPERVKLMLAQSNSGSMTAGVKLWAETPGSGMPMLPPGQIHAGARRWAVKLFLAHAWEAHHKLSGTWDAGYTPYAIKNIEGHSHVIACPNL